MATPCQPTKLVLPSMKTWRPRSAAGENKVSRSDTAVSSTPTTTPASNSTSGCPAPRASSSVSMTPPSAPMKAAPSKPSCSSAVVAAAPHVAPIAPPAVSTSTTPRLAPAAEPSR